MLAAKNLALDHPVDTAAAKNFVSAFGPHAGDVAGKTICGLRARGRLPCGKIGDPFGPDGQLLHM